MQFAEHMDCRTQRAQAMKKLQANPNSGNYVPTCTGENDMYVYIVSLLLSKLPTNCRKLY